MRVTEDGGRADIAGIRDKLVLDPEAKALAECVRALDTLDGPARLRVLRYLADRFEVDIEALHRD